VPCGDGGQKETRFCPPRVLRHRHNVIATSPSAEKRGMLWDSPRCLSARRRYAHCHPTAWFKRFGGGGGEGAGGGGEERGGARTLAGKPELMFTLCPTPGLPGKTNFVPQYHHLIQPHCSFGSISFWCGAYNRSGSIKNYSAGAL
jgi:hypothetical protein